MTKKKFTSIPATPKTRRRFLQFQRQGEKLSWDEILSRVLDYAEKTETLELELDTAQGQIKLLKSSLRRD